MDPITHGLLGAAAAHAVASKKVGRLAAVAGAAAGMAPDLDFLLRGAGDPALPWELHRHFTHALAFTPAGAAICAAPFLAARAARGSRPAVYLAALAGYVTHGLLDCATSFGTRWLWPFSTLRLSWDLVAIVDPVFSLILLAGVALALRRSHRRPAAVALAACAVYLGLGAAQHARAVSVVRQAAAARGHEVTRMRVMPTLGNVVLWRAVYVAADRIHADGVRVPPVGRAALLPGSSVPLVVPRARGREEPPRVTDVLERFHEFADGYTAIAPQHPDVVGDMRYSAETTGFAPLWGIRVRTDGPGDPVAWADLLAGGPPLPVRLLRVLTGRTLTGP